MRQSFCFFFQKEALSCFVSVIGKAVWYKFWGRGFFAFLAKPSRNEYFWLRHFPQRFLMNGV
jgi:hypothetical protein